MHGCCSAGLRSPAPPCRRPYSLVPCASPPQVGPNGAGKSTLLKLMTGQVRRVNSCLGAVALQHGGALRARQNAAATARPKAAPLCTAGCAGVLLQCSMRRLLFPARPRRPAAGPAGRHGEAAQPPAHRAVPPAPDGAAARGRDAAGLHGAPHIVLPVLCLLPAARGQGAASLHGVLLPARAPGVGSRCLPLPTLPTSPFATRSCASLGRTRVRRRCGRPSAASASPGRSR